MSPDQSFELEAIIDEDLRPAIDIVGGTFIATHERWKKLSDNVTLKSRIEAAIPSVGRIELPGNRRYPYGGTGFVVGERLLMTNRHVAEIFSQGLGNRKISFLPDAKAGVDFLRERSRPTGPTLVVRRTLMIHPYWDMAILEVEGLDQRHRPLRLSLRDARQLREGHEIFVVGYPAFDPRNPADVQQKLFDSAFGIKRLQPGALHGTVATASFGKVVQAVAHDCSTLGGNSGSAVLDLENGEVLGLHFGGQYHDKNYAVPASELARDSRVVDAGVSFAGTPPGGAGDWSDWWTRVDAAETAPSDTRSPDPHLQSPATAGTVSPAGPQLVSDGSIRIELPLIITVSLGGAVQRIGTEASLATEAPEAQTESLQEPFHDEDYADRSGYDPAFLNDPAQPGTAQPDVPLPRAADDGVVARTNAGGDILHYQNFSIVMHAKRRLALFTASNVTDTPTLRKPEPGRDYTRKGLSGLEKNAQEKWYLDPRLDARYQLPDVFFNKDRAAFDKGHIVRRDDVAWGRTFDELRRANGDSYHVTNCSPQVKEFNRSTLGEANWGDLENHVLSEAANERLCVFAGPVLDDADRIFTGAGGGSVQLRARIPSRFWKIIVARVIEGPAAYGFVLEQDLSGVEWEFAVPEEFAPVMYPVADIAAMTGVAFPSAIVDNDQYETTRGADIATRSGTKRKRRKGS